MATNSKWWWTLIPVLALAVALPLTVKRLANPRERVSVAPRAATPTGTATLSFVPSTTAVLPGQALPVTVNMFTPPGANDHGITGVKATINVTPATAVTITSTNITTPLASPWSYVRKDVVTTGNTTTITIEAVYLQSGVDGYLGANTTPQAYAVLNFTAASATVTANPTLTFDTTNSEIRRKVDNADILSTNLTPGSYTIYVDQVAPDTQITGNPPAVVTSNSANFTFSGSDTPPPTPLTPGALTFAYRLDQGALSAYSSSTSATVSNLSVGNHTFFVQAKDAAGNVDATPAQWAFAYTPSTLVSLQFKLPGKTTTGGHAAQTIQFTVRNGSFNSGPITATATYSGATTNYSIPATTIPNLSASGTYDILVKVPGSLQKLWTGNTVTVAQTNALTRTATGDVPIWGDLTGDNTLQLSDLTLVLGAWTQSDTPTTPATQLYDLDENGFISLSDITAIISNWTTSVVNGDI